MATNNTPSPERGPRNRHNVYLGDDLWDLCEKMAEQDRRGSNSNFLEWLISEEAKRRELPAKDGKADEAKAA